MAAEIVARAVVAFADTSMSEIFAPVTESLSAAVTFAFKVRVCAPLLKAPASVMVYAVPPIFML